MSREKESNHGSPGRQTNEKNWALWKPDNIWNNIATRCAVLHAKRHVYLRRYTWILRNFPNAIRHGWLWVSVRECECVFICVTHSQTPTAAVRWKWSWAIYGRFFREHSLSQMNIASHSKGANFRPMDMWTLAAYACIRRESVSSAEAFISKWLATSKHQFEKWLHVCILTSRKQKIEKMSLERAVRAKVSHTTEQSEQVIVQFGPSKKL